MKIKKFSEFIVNEAQSVSPGVLQITNYINDYIKRSYYYGKTRGVIDVSGVSPYFPIKKVRIKFDTNPKTAGWFDPVSSTPDSVKIGINPEMEDINGILVHEVTHAFQFHKKMINDRPFITFLGTITDFLSDLSDDEEYQGFLNAIYYSDKLEIDAYAAETYYITENPNLFSALEYMKKFDPEKFTKHLFSLEPKEQNEDDEYHLFDNFHKYWILNYETYYEKNHPEIRLSRSVQKLYNKSLLDFMIFWKKKFEKSSNEISRKLARAKYERMSGEY